MSKHFICVKITAQLVRLGIIPKLRLIRSHFYTVIYLMLWNHGDGHSTLDIFFFVYAHVIVGDFCHIMFSCVWFMPRIHFMATDNKYVLNTIKYDFDNIVLVIWSTWLIHVQLCQHRGQTKQFIILFGAMSAYLQTFHLIRTFFWSYIDSKVNHPVTAPPEIHLHTFVLLPDTNSLESIFHLLYLETDLSYVLSFKGLNIID